MVPGLLLLQLVAAGVPAPPRPIYDVDVLLLQGRDTIPLPPVRLSEGLEGRVLLAGAGAPLLYRTLVRQDAAAACPTVTVALGDGADSAVAAVLPPVAGLVCGGAMQPLGGAAGVLVQVRRVARPEER